MLKHFALAVALQAWHFDVDLVLPFGLVAADLLSCRPISYNILPDRDMLIETDPYPLLHLHVAIKTHRRKLKQPICQYQGVSLQVLGGRLI